MTNRRRTIVLIAAAMLALMVAAPVVMPGPAPSRGNEVLGASASNNANPGCRGARNESCTDNPNAGGPTKSFGVTVGDVAGVYPTGVTEVPLDFSNPHAFAIRVTTLEIVVGDPGQPDCTAGDLAAESPSGVLGGGIDVPARGSVSTTFDVGLPADAPDDCQAASWTVTVTATAVKR